MKQTQLMTVDDCSGLSDDELRDMANMFGEKCQQAAKKTVEDAVTAGTALLAMKARVQHGEWLKWLGSNWDYDPRTAQTYMTLSLNRKRFVFENVGSIRDAMSMIAAQQTEEAAQETPRSERKSGRVEIVKPDDESRQQSVQPDENAVSAEPKTNTKHSKDTAKAKEEDRSAPMKVTPELIDEPETPKQWPEVSLEDLINGVIKKLEHDKQKKAAAKTLRKLADTLDPPKKFAPPDIDEVRAYCRERRNDIDPESFVAHYATNGWKLSNGNKMVDWKSAVITWEKSNGTGSRRTAAGNTGRGKPITDF